MVSGISDLDLMIIVIYFVLVLGIGIWIGTKTKTEEDLFLGGRSLTWGVIGFSLFASNISSTTLIGLSGAAYTSGIAVSNYEWLSGLPLIIMAAIFIPVYLNARITTVPEFLELRFDSRSRKIFSAVTIVISVLWLIRWRGCIKGVFPIDRTLVYHAGAGVGCRCLHGLWWIKGGCLY